MSVSRHTLKQLKFILPGGLITYYLDSHAAFWRVVNADADIDGWGRIAAYASLGSATLTISLFMYILSIPLLQGQQPNYRRWRESGVLSSVIPLLTASIVVGWSLLSYTLGRWSKFGVIEGVIASSGLYALTFGLLGLIPAPKVPRQ
ncbi:uncharacterized protein C8Q71DRAFT_750134 [Rhodofomes roseus]|uniref:Uncharacterized protein n=1 Tax=Rhodofomes roseus TaxID=34475 RepID=A0ABQ8KJE4_9APHY|nr:uncharacterized protein C8Q71DRAFT_750134 [Rhodofomes roseus]KAH9838239.1 hypothetical protein C8Q71DRAFT_750134 [Rhodofomes roseus]